MAVCILCGVIGFPSERFGSLDEAIKVTSTGIIEDRFAGLRHDLERRVSLHIEPAAQITLDSAVNGSHAEGSALLGEGCCRTSEVGLGLFAVTAPRCVEHDER